MDDLKIELDDELENNDELLDVKDLKNNVEGVNEKGEKTFKYPFQMYFGHDYRNVAHIFVKDKEYTEKEIINELKNHGYKEFNYAKVKLEFISDENCIFVKFEGIGSRG